MSHENQEFRNLQPMQLLMKTGGFLLYFMYGKPVSPLDSAPSRLTCLIHENEFLRIQITMLSYC